jgi:hypothetical protein
MRSLNELDEKLGFRKDPRIKFVGTVYNQELLKEDQRAGVCILPWAFSGWYESEPPRSTG